MRTALFKLLPFLLGLAAVQASAQAPPGNYVLKNARVEIGDGKVLEKATIVVSQGKIAAINPQAVESGYEVIDLTGKTVYPGFIDAYATRGLKLPDAPEPGTPPDSTSTAPAFMWAGNRKGQRPDVKAAQCLDLENYLEDAHGQGITAAFLAPGGGSLRGMGALVAFEPGEKQTVLKADFGHEMSFRNGSGAGYPGNILGVIALMRQTLYDAQRYAQHTLPEKDAGLEALRPLMTGQTPAVFAANSELEIGRAFNLAEEFDLKLIITGGREAFRVADRLKASSTPVLVSVSIGDEPRREPRENDRTPKEVLAYRADQWAERSKNIVGLHKAGVQFAFSSDGDLMDRFLDNVRRVIGTGLPRQAALEAMTASPARIFGLDSQLGTIATGKLANLIVMDGDFAKEETKVEMVFVNGKKVELKKEGN